MVVANGKLTLCFYWQAARKGFGQAADDLDDVLLQVDGKARLFLAQLGQVILRVAQQDGKDRSRCGRCSAVVSIADGGVDSAPQGSALYVFQHGEQAPQPVAGMQIGRASCRESVWSGEAGRV